MLVKQQRKEHDTCNKLKPNLKKHSLHPSGSHAFQIQNDKQSRETVDTKFLTSTVQKQETTNKSITVVNSTDPGAFKDALSEAFK